MANRTEEPRPELRVDPALAERLRSGERVYPERTARFYLAMGIVIGLMLVGVGVTSFAKGSPGWLGERWSFVVLAVAWFFQFLHSYSRYVCLTDNGLVIRDDWMRTRCLPFADVIAVRARYGFEPRLTIDLRNPDATRGECRIVIPWERRILDTILAELISRCDLRPVRVSKRETIWQRANALPVRANH